MPKQERAETLPRGFGGLSGRTLPGTMLQLDQLGFEPNLGQTDPQVEFLARGRAKWLFLTASEAVFVLFDVPPDGIEGYPAREKPHRPGISAGTAVFRMEFLDTNPCPGIIGVDELPWKTNHFIGNDPDCQFEGIPNFAGVRYQDLYPGVDVLWHEDNGQLRFDLLLSPGADPDRIRIAYAGADELTVDEDGTLRFVVAGIPVRQLKPEIFQEARGERTKIAGGYVVEEGSRLRFRMEDFDHLRGVVIDPTLEFSTFVGGNFGARGDAVALDTDGEHVYIVGSTSSTVFPPPGTPPPPLGQNAFVSKFHLPPSPTVIWTTWIGGSGDDRGINLAFSDCALGSAVGDFVFATGITDSSDLPVSPFSNPSYYSGGKDAFVARLDPVNGNIVMLTYIGGLDDEEGLAVAGDFYCRAYIAGSTASDNSEDFPITANAFQQSYGGGSSDGFLTVIDAMGLDPVTGDPRYSTYFGGEELDKIKGLAIAPSNEQHPSRVFVTGDTASSTFPVQGPLTIGCQEQSTYRGGILDAFVAKLFPDSQGPQDLVYSTYVGGSDEDQGQSIAIDEQFNAYVSMQTRSLDFPLLHAFQPAHAGGMDGAIVKLDPSGSRLVFSTYLGGSDDECASAISVDGAGRPHVLGFSISTDFPLKKAYQGDQGKSDLVLAQMTPGGAALYFGTYLGGSNNDYVWDSRCIAVDTCNRTFATGATRSADYPLVDPTQTSFSGYDAVLSMFQNTETDPSPAPCVPPNCQFSCYARSSPPGLEMFEDVPQGWGGDFCRHVESLAPFVPAIRVPEPHTCYNGAPDAGEDGADCGGECAFPCRPAWQPISCGMDLGDLWASGRWGDLDDPLQYPALEVRSGAIRDEAGIEWIRVRAELGMYHYLFVDPSTCDFWPLDVSDPLDPNWVHYCRQLGPADETLMRTEVPYCGGSFQQEPQGIKRRHYYQNPVWGTPSCYYFSLAAQVDGALAEGRGVIVNMSEENVFNEVTTSIFKNEWSAFPLLAMPCQGELSRPHYDNAWWEDDWRVYTNVVTDQLLEDASRKQAARDGRMIFECHNEPDNKNRYSGNDPYCSPGCSENKSEWHWPLAQSTRGCIAGIKNAFADAFPGESVDPVILVGSVKACYNATCSNDTVHCLECYLRKLSEKGQEPNINGFSFHYALEKNHLECIRDVITNLQAGTPSRWTQGLPLFDTEHFQGDRRHSTPSCMTSGHYDALDMDGDLADKLKLARRMMEHAEEGVGLSVLLALFQFEGEFSEPGDTVIDQDAEFHADNGFWWTGRGDRTAGQAVNRYCFDLTATPPNPLTDPAPTPPYAALHRTEAFSLLGVLERSLGDGTLYGIERTDGLKVLLNELTPAGKSYLLVLNASTTQAASLDYCLCGCADLALTVVDATGDQEAHEVVWQQDCNDSNIPAQSLMLFEWTGDKQCVTSR